MKQIQRPIIFFDTEFTHLDFSKGELLSIGLVKESGEELYLELDYTGKNIHPWVKKKVLPYLTGKIVTARNAKKKIKSFFGNQSEKDKPYLMAYVNQFDAMYWYRLFDDPKDHPAFWIPLDFASILHAYGYTPDSMQKEKFFADLGIDTTSYIKHNALEDAKLLKEVYKKFILTHNICVAQ